MQNFKLWTALFLMALTTSTKFQSVDELDEYIRTNYEVYPLRHVEEREITFLYNEYLSLFGKTASMFGFAYFNENLKSIMKHNREEQSWKMGINKFVDVSIQDFRHIHLWHEPQNCSATLGNFKSKDVKLPESVDWREMGVVSPVKNQASCGSCWAFSTTGTLEAHWKIKNGGDFLDLAKQQLVDCAGEFDNHGCQGGLPSHAFEYIKHVGGIESESTYPYKAENQKCNFNIKNVVATVKGGSVNITAGNEVHLDEAIANEGPVAICFQVVDDFRFYKEGVYVSKTCKNGPMDVNHAVIAVGYGVENGQKYYIVKNSWGVAWGTNGFFKIERGVNMCGVAMCNSFPLLDGPKLATIEA